MQPGTAGLCASDGSTPIYWKIGPNGRKNGGLLVPSMLRLVVYNSSHLPANMQQAGLHFWEGQLLPTPGKVFMAIADSHDRHRNRKARQYRHVSPPDT